MELALIKAVPTIHRQTGHVARWELRIQITDRDATGFDDFRLPVLPDRPLKAWTTENLVEALELALGAEAAARQAYHDRQAAGLPPLSPSPRCPLLDRLSLLQAIVRERAEYVESSTCVLQQLGGTDHVRLHSRRLQIQ